MVAVLRSLAASMFVIPIRTTIGAAGDHRLSYRLRKSSSTSERIMTVLFLGFISITPSIILSLDPLPEFTNHSSVLMPRGRTSMANTLNSHLFSIEPSLVSCYLFDMKILRVKCCCAFSILFLMGWPPY